MRRVLAMTTVIAVALAADMLSTTSAAPSRSVTMQYLRQWDPGCNCYKLRFSGFVSSRAAGEYVTVMQQRCGYSYATAVAGAQTRDGGFWEAEANPVVVGPSGTFRARWNDQLSEPVVVTPKISVFAIEIRKQRWRVSVFTSGVKQDMTGREVALQRKRGRTWTTIRRARLSRGSGPFASGFGAIFVVGERGWTLRGFVPDKSAAPCFTAGVSRAWVS
jgi:hypothetical protein